MVLEDLYNEVLKNLSPERLNDITQKIIGAYRSGNNAFLKALHEAIPPGAGTDTTPPARLFLTLIKHFHPDRFKALSSDIEESYRAGNTDRLKFYHGLLSADRHAHREMEDRFAFDFEETFSYDEDTGAYRSFAMGGEDAFDSVSERDIDLDFIDALKAELFGNLDVEFSMYDLEQLEGDLVLRGYGIRDLEGLDYCVHVTRLDLSGNSIESLYELSSLGYLNELYLSGNEITDIDPLKHLENLEILDLSNNDIEDVDILARLPSLKVVNLRGNPVGSIDSLTAAGIAVLR